MREHAVSEQLKKTAFDFGVEDARASAAWQQSLEQKLWGKVLPDFTLEQKAVVLAAYGRGWLAAGRELPPGHPLPERTAEPL